MLVPAGRSLVDDMKKLFKLLVFLTALIVSSIPLWAGERSPVPLTVLHINDLHGHLLPYIDKGISETTPVGAAARLARMIADERTKDPDGCLLLSAGDMFQGAPLSNVFQGQSVIEVMNYLKFDAMAIGNHEFDWGLSVLNRLVAAASFPFLSANIQDKPTKRLSENTFDDADNHRIPPSRGDKGGCQGSDSIQTPPYPPQGGNFQTASKGLPLTKPYVILTRKNLKIGIIGLTTPETVFTTNPDSVRGLTFREPGEVLPPMIREVRSKGAKLIVVLSHSGLDADRRIAEQVSGIAVIVGGHSHTAMTYPLRIKDTIIVQAGCYGAYLGVLQLKVDPTTYRIVDYTRDNELKAVFSGPDDPVDEKVVAIVERFNDQIKGEFARVVGETSVDLVRSPKAESNVGNLVSDAMRWASGADMAFQNSGGIRTDIPKGKITMEQIYTLLPFDNMLIVMDLTGKQIREILEENTHIEHGILQVSGITVQYDLTRPVGSRVIEARVGNAALEPVKTYRVATNDFLAAGGDHFALFQEGKNIVYGDSLRDAFIAYLEKHSPVHPEVEKRVVFNNR